MRGSLRLLLLGLLVGIWPQLGCVQLPTNKSVQDLRPIQPTASIAPKQETVAANSGQAAFAQAEALERAGKAAEAAALYEKLREPGSPHAWQATKKLAQLYLRYNELDRAEEEFRLLLTHQPKDADTLANLGDISYRRGHWGTATKFLTDALQFQPDHAFARHNLGMTLAQLGRYDESLEIFTKILSKSEAYCEVAFVMQSGGKPEDAMRAYQTALTHEPGNQRARTEMAKMHQQDPGLAMRLMTTPKVEKRGIVDLEPAAPALAAQGTSRLMMQRPTLPPLPDIDLPFGNEPRAKKN